MERQDYNQDYNKEMLEFIKESPTSFHVIANLKRKMDEAGFAELSEREEWEVSAGGRYYVIRNDSSMIAFQVPEGEVHGFHMAASHSDSPTFKIKEHPETEVEGHYVRLNTEKYGGMILSTWLDRPLSVAGRIVVKGEKKPEAGDTGARAEQIVTKLVNIDRDLLVIPNVAIHMNREMNKGVEYNPQVDMLPLYADCTSACGEKSGVQHGTKHGMLLKEIAESAGVQPEEILGHDLFLYVRDAGRVLGSTADDAGEAFVVSPKLDDLQCVYASMKAFCTSAPKEYISLCAVFDNEEVGSGTGQGADSTFLEDVIARVCDGLCGQERGEILRKRWIAGSFLISADNAHAVHPNHLEKADPTNRPYLNGGIVIKYHGSQKYTTDAVSAARMKLLCERAGVPFQTYANRSDIAGGSTLGNISNAHVSVSSVDVGLPQLAMHSAVETGGARDTEYAVKMFRIFFAE
jgi:aspartyl aminopeptidase